MPKKKDELEEIQPEIDNSKPTTPVKVVVKREHCLSPHSIELRKDDDGMIIDARTEDFQHTETIGAKLVSTILGESGVAVPDTDEIELEISFSPFNGEVIAIAVKPPEVITPE